MLVSQIMQKDFVTVQQNDLIQEAADKMKEKQVPVLLVLEEEHVKGIVTEKAVTKAMADTEASAAGDETNRCCYFNDVQVDLLLNGYR